MPRKESLHKFHARLVMATGKDDDDDDDDDNKGWLVGCEISIDYDMSPTVHCNLCNSCYTLGMPGPRPDIRCV